MPGRPRKMAERAMDLEGQALSFWDDVVNTCPEQYLVRPDPDDSLCKSWNDAVEAAEGAMFAVQDLADRLRKRAHIDDPGPVAEASIREPGASICLNCMAAHRRAYAGIEPAAPVDGCLQDEGQTTPAAGGEAQGGP